MQLGVGSTVFYLDRQLFASLIFEAIALCGHGESVRARAACAVAGTLCKRFRFYTQCVWVCKETATCPVTNHRFHRDGRKGDAASRCVPTGRFISRLFTTLLRYWIIRKRMKKCIDAIESQQACGAEFFYWTRCRTLSFINWFSSRFVFRYFVIKSWVKLCIYIAKSYGK